LVFVSIFCLLSFLLVLLCWLFSLFFFKDPATTEIYTLSLHDALPIWVIPARRWRVCAAIVRVAVSKLARSSTARCNRHDRRADRSEEHTSELQSRSDLVCRLLLEKKKKKQKKTKTKNNIKYT